MVQCSLYLEVIVPCNRSAASSKSDTFFISLLDGFKVNFQIYLIGFIVCFPGVLIWIWSRCENFRFQSVCVCDLINVILMCFLIRAFVWEISWSIMISSGPPVLVAFNFTSVLLINTLIIFRLPNHICLPSVIFILIWIHWAMQKSIKFRN